MSIPDLPLGELRPAAPDGKGGPPLSQTAEDEWFFDRHPERQFRLRPASAREHTGEVPAGASTYAIVARSGARETFVASRAFDPQKSDAQIRQLLTILRASWVLPNTIY